MAAVLIRDPLTDQHPSRPAVRDVSIPVVVGIFIIGALAYLIGATWADAIRAITAEIASRYTELNEAAWSMICAISTTLIAILLAIVVYTTLHICENRKPIV
jgi:hypothetical protein